MQTCAHADSEAKWLFYGFQVNFGEAIKMAKSHRGGHLLPDLLKRCRGG